MSCPLHGCKRVYTEPSALENHIKDHQILATSIPGKVLLCSSSGCGASFPNMQKLMEHMRHHHKPNIYFQCESCRTKLRSYRGLLAHLHTCSKVPRSKAKAAEPTPPQSAAGPPLGPDATEQQPPRLESACLPQQITHPDRSLSAALQLGSADPPVLGPPILPLSEPPHPQVISSNVSEAPSDPPASGLAPSAADFPEVQQQTPSRTMGLSHPAPGPALHSPPGSSAVWKKNQGLPSNRRVLWEHTRGRYTCVQCGHTVTNRKDVTQHIKSQHSGTKGAGDPGAT